MSSVVRLCPMCLGANPPRDPEACFSCRPASVRPGTHPGPGFRIEARALSEFEPGAVLVDAWTGERWELSERGKKFWMQSLDRAYGHELDRSWYGYEGDRRYITPEEAADPSTWVKPARPEVDMATGQAGAEPSDARQGVLL